MVDTNILLNRPEMLGVLLKDCALVYIPIPVIDELNYHKDNEEYLANIMAEIAMITRRVE